MLTPFSYGIVAANKPLSTTNIEVTPIEVLTMLDGELTDNLSTRNTKLVDASGGAHEAVAHSAQTLTARWLPMGSNRVTAPDVRRGEKVQIWKFADADKYYWSSLEYDRKLRKRETIILAISNTDKEDVSSLKDYEYFLEISTHNKLVHFHTSTSDGEAVGYDFVLNTKASNFQITDTMDNTLFIDSLIKRIVLKTGGNASFDLNDEDLFINVPRNAFMKVGGNFFQEVGGTTTYVSKGKYAVDAPRVDFVTPEMYTSKKFFTGDDATVSGNLILGKGMSTGASGGGSGSVSINGALNGNSSATFTGRVKASNID